MKAFIIAFVIMSTCFAFLDGWVENRSVSLDEATVSISGNITNSLLQPEGTSYQTDVGAVSMVSNLWGWVKLFWNGLSWNYPSLFAGNGQWLRWIGLLSFSIALIAEFLFKLRGTG